MRVINLDEIGIKLLNNKKNQIYLSREELSNFVDGKYTIMANKLSINGKELTISDAEIKELPTIISHIKTMLLYHS